MLLAQKDYNELCNFRIVAISPEQFLKKYFTLNELKEPLADIGLNVGGTKNQKIHRIIENWNMHHRDWYDLLDFLDWNKLSKICDDFKIRYSDFNTEDMLCKKIKDAEVIDSTKKFIPKVKLDKITKDLQKTKINPYLIYTLIGWMGIGVIFAILNISGIFLEPHPEEIDISKKYQVTYETWTDENTLSGLIEGMSLTGKITLQSTQFTAHNKIDVHIELSPNTGSNVEDIVMLDSITPPFNVYFVGAQHHDKENEYFLADILMKRSSDRPKLIGDGSLVYPKGGNYEIYLLDSSELSLKQDLLTVHDPNGSLVLFPQLKNSVNPNGYYDENGNKIKIPTRVEYFDENYPYTIEIKQSDALNSLSSDKMGAFVTWITLAFVPLTIISVLKYIPINKISKTS